MAQAYRSESAKIALANWKQRNDEKTYWEKQFLQPLETAYQQTEKSARAKAGYDISNAYSNYLQYQRNLENSSLLGTSQAELGKQAESSYLSSYGKAQSEYASSVNKAYDTYKKGVEEAEKTLTNEAENVSKILNQADEYIASNYGNWGYTEDDYKNMYQYTKEGTKKLTEVGKQLYAKTFEDINPETGRSDFWEGIRTSSPELYEYASGGNYEKLANIIGEYDPNTYDYRASRSQDITAKHNEDIKSGNVNKDFILKSYAGNKEYLLKSGSDDYKISEKIITRKTLIGGRDVTDYMDANQGLAKSAFSEGVESYLTENYDKLPTNKVFEYKGRKFYKTENGVIYALEKVNKEK